MVIASKAMGVICDLCENHFLYKGRKKPSVKSKKVRRKWRQSVQVTLFWKFSRNRAVAGDISGTKLGFFLRHGRDIAR